MQQLNYQGFQSDAPPALWDGDSDDALGWAGNSCCEFLLPVGIPALTVHPPAPRNFWRAAQLLVIAPHTEQLQV